MFGAGARKKEQRREPGDLFAQVGMLLHAQGLSPDPANYAFAHHLLSRNDAEAAAIVDRIMGEGIRLTGREIEALGAHVITGAPTPVAEAPGEFPHACDDAGRETERLVAQTRVQADAVAAMARAMHDETREFGRDLAESAALFDAAGAGADPARIVGLTAMMVRRAADAEERLASATREADTLRIELAEAQASARCDPLTGLANRRGFEEAFAGIDPAHPHCLALCDVDRFKRINDEFGHPVGDRVLTALSRLLTQACAGHLVARHGGEEFVLLLAGVDLAEATTILEGARAAIAARRLRDRDSDAPIGRVTVSAGLVAILPGESCDAALTRADALLYRAKDMGRDRVLAA